MVTVDGNAVHPDPTPLPPENLATPQEQPAGVTMDLNELLRSGVGGVKGPTIDLSDAVKSELPKNTAVPSPTRSGSREVPIHEVPLILATGALNVVAEFRRVFKWG